MSTQRAAIQRNTRHTLMRYVASIHDVNAEVLVDCGASDNFLAILLFANPASLSYSPRHQAQTALLRDEHRKEGRKRACCRQARGSTTTDDGYAQLIDFDFTTPFNFCATRVSYLCTCQNAATAAPFLRGNFAEKRSHPSGAHRLLQLIDPIARSPFSASTSSCVQRPDAQRFRVETSYVPVG